MTAAASPDTPKKTVTKAKTTKKSESTTEVAAPLKTTKKPVAEPKTIKKIDAPVLEVEKPSAPKKPAANRKPAEQSDSPMLIFVTAEERHGMVCNAAYYIAERRGFVGGDPFQDWVEAEQEVDRLLGGSTTL